jgi:glyoxylase-like metal-dependent hydrolase (beta-lactamase superfamily II)
MRRVLVAAAVMVLLSPLAGHAQDGRAALTSVSKALGADSLKSLQFSAAGQSFAAGQSAVPGAPWPAFNVTTFTRQINYETASLRDDLVRSRAEMPPRGGGTPAMGELRQILVVSGDYAWNVTGDAGAPAPIALIERQLQLWASPHGFVRAAMANNVSVSGRTIAFASPGRFMARATLDDAGLIGKVDAVLSNPVTGDTPAEFTYSDYRDFGGVKVPMRIRQSFGGFPTLDLTVSDVKINAPTDMPAPDNVRQATMPYARVVSEQAAPGVWYLTGGSHHSVVIEMKDHVIVVESPLNDERAVAVLAEARKLVPGKSIRYVINSHHHFDHAGGLRAVAADGITVITHESSRAFFEQALAAPATMTPDRQAKVGRKPIVEGVRDRRTMTDGPRTVEIYHIAGNTHSDGLLMVYLPKERFLVEADVYTPAPPNAPAPAAVNPLTVNLAENITRLGLGVNQLLPLHGRMVPLADMNKAIGRAN